MSKIQSMSAYQVIDSRGNPTVAAEVVLQNGEKGWAAVPSGASTGTREAIELRDNDMSKFHGKGVQKAIANIVGPIRDAVWDHEFKTIQEFDNSLIKLDGTLNKSRLGANATLAVSLAMAKAMSLEADKSLFRYLHVGNEYVLPVPMMNIINGGAHADNNLDIQEFMILPIGAPSFSDAVRYGTEIFHALKSLLKKQGLSTSVGDEGGFAPTLSSNIEALDLIMEAISAAGYKPGSDIYLGLDVASSEFYRDGFYHLAGEKRQYNAEQFIDYLKRMSGSYPIISIEDGMAEQDWVGWARLTQELGSKLQLVGDDIFVTNPTILREGIEKQIANAILIKPNQIGTLSETLETIAIAKAAGYNTIISHRSGETEDTTIADIAVGTNAGQIKTGSLCRTDRVAKYNRLLHIEHVLGSQAYYAGMTVFARWL